MNKENAGKLWKMIQEAGDYLLGQLPDHPNHPKGRNPYAHVAICVKSKFEKSYKDIPDEKFTEVVEYIDFLKKNPSCPEEHLDNHPEMFLVCFLFHSSTFLKLAA